MIIYVECVLQESWRRVVSTGVQQGIPMPCFTTALSFYDGYRHEMLPANLLQVNLSTTHKPVGYITWFTSGHLWL